MRVPKLKSCPFCGGEAEFRQMNYLGIDSDPYYIICTKCNMQTATTFESKAKQAKDWNRRVNGQTSFNIKTNSRTSL